MLNIIGDSHALYCFNGIDGRIENINSRTCYRMVRDNVPLHWLNPGDDVCFIFGEVDCRCHIGRIADRDNVGRTTVIGELATGYVGWVKSFRESLRIRPIIASVLPPSDSGDNPQYPFYGTLDDRISITKRFNLFVKMLCEDHQILFLDLYGHYANPDGSLDVTRSDGGLHVAMEHNGYCREQLLEVVNRV